MEQTTKKRFLLNLKNFKARVNLDTTIDESWNKIMTRLINLGDTINNNLELFNDEEIMDIIKIYDTASMIHDITKVSPNEENQLNILENLISQGESQVSLILNINHQEPPSAISKEEKSQEELEQSLFNIKDDIDFFGTKLIFINRDSRKKEHSKEKNNQEINSTYLKTYFNIVTKLYQKLQEVYDIICAIINESGYTANANLINKLESLVNIMYHTLVITDSKTMRINLGSAGYAINKIEESFINTLRQETSYNKL